MRLLISLMLVTTIAGAQEVRAPQRGEERREQRVERPEPVRVQPPVQEQRRDEPSRQPEPRPEPPRPNNPPLVRTVYPPIFIGGSCWDRGECRGVNPWIQMRFDFDRRQRMNRNRNPRWDNLTEKQKRQLLDARNDFRERVQRILNNP
jgi:hypothetical protein